MIVYCDILLFMFCSCIIKMQSLYFLLVCSLTVFVNCGVIKKLYKLDIVHYNDFHARFEETTVLYPICTTNNTECIGGFARLYQGIHTLLKEKPGALLLDAGDTFQGTYWYTLMKWNITEKFINKLPNDAHALGNHEFDDGVAGLAPYLAALQAPVVAANIDISKEPSLKDLIKPYIVIEKRGRKIGIIGVITTETATSSNPDNVVFLDPIEAAQREAQILTDKGVDIIILLSHCGLQDDIKLAKTVGKNIDVIVGGHSHELLWNGTSPSNEHISGPYPLLVNSEEDAQHKVLVVTASAFSKYVGNLSVYFDDVGELQNFEGEPVFLNRSIPEDAKIKAELQPYVEDLHQKMGEVVGYAKEDLVINPCGGGECAFGDFTADAFVNASKEAVVTNYTHVGFLLRNLVRGSIPQGEINRGAIINVLPFTNKVVSFVLPGRYLHEALERCLTKSWSEKPFKGPWMPLVSGLEVTLNTTSRSVVSVLVEEDNGPVPLDLDKSYQVTSIFFLYRGGGDFKMFKEHATNVTIVGYDSEIMEKYIKRLSPVMPTSDKRLIIVE